MRSLTEEDSKRITSLRFLLIVFVVFKHNNLSADDAINYYHLAFNEPAVITWFKFLVTEVLGGAAVPLFFLFAGYLQFCKQDSYPVLLKKRAKSLLVPYVAWTVITVALFFIAQSVPQLSAFFQNENNIVRNWNFTDWISLFWVHNEVYPLVYQFWFLRNLIVLVLFSPILVLLARKLPFLVIVGISLCFLYAIHTPFLGTSLNKLSFQIIPLHGAWCLVQFIVPHVLCIAIGTGIGIALKKILPPVFAILNGSRK